MVKERNSSDVPLAIKSSIENGYFIDYDKTFANLSWPDLIKGWDQWRKYYPQAYSFVTLSIPAYDSTTGYVLQYIGEQG
jgi:hypothetical protein